MLRDARAPTKKRRKGSGQRRVRRADPQGNSSDSDADADVSEGRKPKRERVEGELQKLYMRQSAGSVSVDDACIQLDELDLKVGGDRTAARSITPLCLTAHEGLVSEV